MSAQAVNFQLFIRSGRGAAHSQRDCLNLTIVSFHSISSNSLKIGFGRSTLEGRFCESWNFFALPYSTGITKKKKLSFFYESNASNPVWAWPDKFSSDLSGLLITIQLSPRKDATTQWLFCKPEIPDFPARPGHNNQRTDLTSLLFDLLGLLFQPDNPIIGEACQRKQLTFNFLSAQAAGPRIRNATA